MIDDKTQAVIAALLTLPVAQKILESVHGEKYQGQGMPEMVDTYFRLKKLLKRRFDEGG
ncbi:MAG: hypothetical protein MUP21_04820 [Dehalococcoidia bacterium]|jgi:hypothetical protein|nr:hypothetical protein [Dehalococcoidia bacterium]